LGFVLLIRAADVVNFAQGHFAMIGAYLMVLFLALGVNYYLSILLVTAALAAFGVAFMFLTYWPLRFRSPMSVIIATIGASIFLENLVLLIAGPDPQRVASAFGTQGFPLGSVYL